MGRDYVDPTFDEDKDLSEIWPQVVHEYEKTTKQKLDSKTTFAAFQIQIDQDIERSVTKSHQHTRKVLNNIGSCLETFGNLIVQGASVVFGPASQCWNAISFVIQVGRKFGDILDGFVTLMERSSAFLRRLNFFLQQECDRSGSQLPSHLRKPAYAILSQFLGVLRSSYSLATSKRERMKTMVGVLLFNSDAGVAESLSLMESQIQDFTHAQVDQILVDVKGLARYLRESDEERSRHQSEIQEYLEAVNKVSEEVLSVTQQIKATIDGRTTKDQHKEALSKIAKALAFQKAGEAESWDKRHREISKRHVKDTGQWLEDHNAFVQWADVNTNGARVLLLEANSGFEKTHVFNHAVSCIQKRYWAGTGSNQAHLAYYYYGDDKDDAVERLVGSIIYQFAETDVGYASAVASACARSASVARAEDRWSHLVLRLQNHMKGTYFICIDGFDCSGQLDNADATISAITQRATTQPDSSGVSFRLFVTGSEETLSKVPRDFEGVQTIVLGSREGLESRTQLNEEMNNDPSPNPLLNASDLEAVTRARVMDICKAKIDLKDILNESNIKILVEGIRGNYNHLEAKITEINACDTIRKVQDVISNTSDDMSTVQRNNIKALETSLNSHQLQKLNELLVWVAGIGGGPTIKFLQSALYFTFRENFLLESEITNTYSALLKIDEYGAVTFKSDELRKIMSESDTSDAKAAVGGLHIEELSRAEVDLCRRFIKNACDPIDYNRFKFDEFFNTIALKTHLHLAEDNAVNFTVLSSCVNVLCEGTDDINLEKLRQHASVWFYEYLKILVENFDSFEPNRQSLGDLGRRLVDLFYEPEVIDAWFLDTNCDCLMIDWLYKDDFIDPLLKFWKNPHVAKGYATDNQKDEWVKKIVAESANKYLVLERVAARLAYHWFSCTTITSEDYLWISYGIVAKGANKPFDRYKSPTLPEVDRFIQWAKAQGFGIDDHTWAYRKGVTYVTFEYYREAVLAFEIAEQHSEATWGVVYGLSRAYQQLKDFRAALKYVDEFKLLSNQLLDTDKDYKEAHWTVLVMEGNCRRQCQDYTLAAQCFKDILNHDVGDQPWVYAETLNGLFNTWNENKDYQLLIDFMRSWRDAENKERGPTFWLQKTTQTDRIHGCIIAAAKNTETLEDVCSLYQEAIDEMTKLTKAAGGQRDESLIDARAQLQYFLAALRFHGSQSQCDHDRGIQSWEDMIRKCEDAASSRWKAYDASRKLAPSLLDKAVEEVLPASLGLPETYSSRLEALARMNNAVIRNERQSQRDPRLCLARLYHLKGKYDSAFLEAKNRLCSVFDGWPKDIGDDSLPLRFQNLAQTLTVLDKDLDAIAAWQATDPQQSQQNTTLSNNAKPTDTGSGLVQSDPPSVEGVNAAEDHRGASRSFEATPFAYIAAFYCDGDCGAKWKDMLADCWVCKHCLCVQLCTGCHRKLQTDDLDPLICNKSHKHLYLPSFDQAMWRSVSPDMIIVDKQPVPRLQWLNKIRDEYGMQQEQIDMLKIEKARELKAATCIAMHYLKWRRKHLKSKTNKDPTIPILRRARTIV